MRPSSPASTAAFAAPPRRPPVSSSGHRGRWLGADSAGWARTAGSVSPGTTWLYRITVNKCKDYLRKKNVRKIFVPIKEASEKFEYTSSTEVNDISKIVMDAISKLPVKLRVPLLLKDIEGFSYQEIAQTISCEMGTVKSRIYRAREGLKKILKPIESELS